MPRLALGLIETTGLAAAIEAADAAAKSANITLIGYELTKGGGLVTVKLEGDVGAVKAAVEAGCAAAGLVNKVWSKQVIPRPHQGLEKIINSKDTITTALSPEQEKKTVVTEALEAEAEFEYLESMQEVAPVVEPQELEAAEAEALPEPEVENDIRECCNLCLDPLCPRKKGELRSTCIHYAEYKEVL